MMKIFKRKRYSFKNGHRPWNKGKHLSEEHKRKLSESRKGYTSWNKGLRAKNNNKILSGNKHGKWKGGKYTSLNHKIRTSVDWKIWREAVFKRDNYTCLKCNKKGVYLEPHHVVPVRKCIQLDYIDLVYDVDNGDTLCKECHNIETFGRID